MINDNQEVLATLAASSIRRYAGLAILLSLGVMLLFVSMSSPPIAFIWRLGLLVLGILVLFLAESLRRATMTGLELTRDELRTTAGHVLARVEDIEGVVRGSFALKPSNGFSVITKHAMPRRWAPGVWWQYGRRLGVGGVISASQAKNMAEILAALLAQRDGV